MSNSQNTRTTKRHFYPKFLTGQRILVLVLVMFIAAAAGILLARPAPSSTPTATEIAQAVNGPATFQRPGVMEYVVKTNSCIVGGTVTSANWHVGAKTVGVDAVDWKTVDYTAFTFKADNGQVFTVSDNDALFMDPGENLGLELDCDPATMNTAKSFGMIAIIFGGK
ncbi:MAG TPA: hypothetical protein VK497_03895 [Candidatus Saccharimonadales bacterium]|nr:hypothetical protein [Candidatus Saccharimonadales bacterium]